MTRRPFAAAATAFLALFSANPASACDLVPAAGQTASYAPDAASPPAVTLRLDLRGEAAACEGASVTILPVSGRFALTGPGGDLPLDAPADPLVRRSGDSLSLTPAALALLAGQQRISVPLGTLAGERFVAPGLYSGTYRLVIDGTVAGEAGVGANVIAVARFAPGQNRVITLDFGEAATGGMVSGDFLYQANAALSLGVRSDSGGRLSHTDDPALSPIPYTASVDGRSVALDGGGTLALAPGQARNGIGSARISFTIPRLPPAWAGRYEDRVTVTLTAH